MEYYAILKKLKILQKNAKFKYRIFLPTSSDILRFSGAGHTSQKNR